MMMGRPVELGFNPHIVMRVYFDALHEMQGHIQFD